MKTISKWLTLAGGIVWGLSACKNAYEPPMAENNHMLVVNSQMDFGNTVEVGGEISFGDLSRGVVRREWTLPDAGVDIVGSDNDRTSTLDNIKIVFNQPGIIAVKLHQEFNGEVFVGNTTRAMIQDTTFQVKVLEKVKAQFTAQVLDKNGVPGPPLNMAPGAVNEVFAGRTIRFTQTSLGEPDTFDWNLAGGDPAQAGGAPAVPTIDVRYSQLGDYSARLIAYRNRPAGRDTLLLENFIRIVPSTDPVTIDRLYASDNKVALKFSRDLQDPKADAANFKVRIENNGKVWEPTVLQASLHASQKNLVLLSLSEAKLYNSDQIVVSYQAGGITTTDGVKAPSFTDKKVEFDVVNLLPALAAGFESGGQEWKNGAWWANGSSVSYPQNNPFMGKYSAFIRNKAQEGMALSYNGQAELKANKTYTVKMMIYVDKAKDGSPWRFEGMNYNEDGKAKVDLFILDEWWGVGAKPIENKLPLQQWVEVQGKFNASATAQRRFLLRVVNEMDLYVDQIVVHEYEPRP
ncbi:hypothetical protein CLV98_102412 [Dyadobacter jejuensis]|uniref:PKD domain-containing protein n=1 Tax=Dyadobacter jejuensis TaxID=1082580 RepID=A0A316AQ14_9BACT|nr:hypothetical protein [Dyadobacter jejuensis]PWJ59578.1 hypothetical protein CLV98_102412 [Dyadobacter jejuensis]